MSTPEDHGALAEEAREVRDAIAVLSSRVEALSVDLQQVNAIAAAQQGVDRRSSEAVFKAAEAIGEARSLEKRLAAQEIEHRQRWDQESSRKLALQRRVRKQTMFASTAVLIISLLCSGAAIGVVRHQANQAADQRVNECLTRVENSKKAVGDMQRLLDSETVSRDPSLRAFIGATRASAQRGALVDCNAAAK